MKNLTTNHTKIEFINFVKTLLILLKEEREEGTNHTCFCCSLKDGGYEKVCCLIFEYFKISESDVPENFEWAYMNDFLKEEFERVMEINIMEGNPSNVVLEFFFYEENLQYSIVRNFGGTL